MTDDTGEVPPQENLKPLRMLVFSMGLIMIGGTVMLAGLVWKKVNAETTGTGAYACAGGEADLKGRGEVINMERDGKNMILTLQKTPQILEIVAIDTCSAKVKTSLLLSIDEKK